MSACTATTKRGIPCRFPARRDTDRCINHEEGAGTAVAAANAGLASGVARRRYPASILGDTVFSLTDHISIQAVLDTVIRLQFAGRLDPKHANIILRACAIASKNFDPVRSYNSPRTRDAHDWFDYFDKVMPLLETIDTVLAETGVETRPFPGLDNEFDEFEPELDDEFDELDPELGLRDLEWQASALFDR